MTLTAKPKRCNFSTQTEYVREWRRWMSENDPEYKIKNALATRKYRLKNAEKMKVIDRKKYLKYCEAIKQKRKENWHSNIEENRKNIREARAKNLPQAAYYSIITRKKKCLIEIDEDYIKSIWPENNLCPVFGIEMKRNKRGESRDSSPSIDKIDPKKGYVPGNVIVVSFKANRMKNNGTVEELKKLLHFYENLQTT